MTARILLIGDQHIRHDNLAAVDRLEQWITARFSQPQPMTHVVLMGDLLDRHSHLEQPLLARADRLLRHILALNNTVQLIVLCGNHDMAHNQVFLTADHWLIVYKSYHTDAPSRLTVVDYPTELPSLPNILFMPYTPDGRFIEALNVKDASWSTKYKAILCHQSFTNIRSIGHLLTEADTWIETWPLVISGHIHDSHWAAPNLLYVGSYIPVANGETNEKSLWTMEVNVSPTAGTALAKPEPTPVNFLSRKTIQVSTRADLTAMLQSQPLDPAQHTRVVVSGTHEQIAAWTRGAEAAALRSQQHVKVVMRMVDTTPAGGLPPTPTSASNLSFGGMVNDAVANCEREGVKQLWTKFRAQHVNLFQSGSVA